jgi:hypothetical protein
VRYLFSWLILILVTVVPAVRVAEAAKTYYVAPTGGSDNNNGTDTSTPFATISHSISAAVAGDTIYLRGGSFLLSSNISIGSSKNGTAASPYNLLAYPGEAPVLDFRNEPYNANNAGLVGITLSGSYWNLKGLTVQCAADNGIKISGSNNTIEQVVTRQNQDSGLIISGSATVHPSNNLILNCDSYGNFDFGAKGENADGFAAKFRGIGTGNVFNGVRSFDNADDGFDFWQAEHGVTVINSWSFHNGKAAVFNNPTGYQGDGNGVKLGHDSSNELLANMLVWGNVVNGVDINGNSSQLEANSNPAAITHGVEAYNVTSVLNGGKNFQFDENPSTATPATVHILQNNISYLGGGTSINPGNIADHNSFAGPAGSPAGLDATAADFVSTTEPIDGVTVKDGSFHAAGTGGDRSGTTTPVYPTGPDDTVLGPRQADGSLPIIDFMRLVAGSHLLGAGVDVGLPFTGAEPDLGYSSTMVVAPPLVGDFNGDHTVDASDYTMWRDSLGGTGADMAADADHNGVIDQKDFLVWQTRFAEVYGSAAGVGSGAGAAGSAAVPEPATLLLVLAAMPFVFRRLQCSSSR